MIITAFLIPDEAELSQLLHTYIEKRASSIMGRQYGLLAWILLERLYLRVAADAARCALPPPQRKRDQQPFLGCYMQ